MRKASLSLLLLICAPTHAQQVHKCSDGKQVVYQSQPCEGRQRTIRQWDATPEPVPATDGPAKDRVKSKQPSTRDSRPQRASRGKTGHASTVDPADARCNAAKARREAKLKSVGLKRTFDLLRKLDDAVQAACS